MAVEGEKRLSLLRELEAGAGKQMRVAARWGIFFLLGYTLSCARVLGTGGPFGMAFVACAGPGAAGVSALLGASLGYLTGSGLDWGLRYLAAAVLVYTVGYVSHETPAYRQPLFMPAAAGVVMAMTGYLGSFAYGAAPRPLWAELFLETALAFGGAYFFREALSGARRSTETEELRHSVSLMILGAINREKARINGQDSDLYYVTYGHLRLRLMTILLLASTRNEKQFGFDYYGRTATPFLREKNTEPPAE